MCIEEGVQEFEELQEFRRGARSQNPGVRRTRDVHRAVEIPSDHYSVVRGTWVPRISDY
jgi:hypothetical protein